MGALLPDLSLETRHREAGEARILGVDEAGRGPLAGPVVACAVWLDPGAVPHGLNDSKRLSPGARERLLNVLRALEIDGHAAIGVGIAEPVEIARRNILWASLAAMERAVGEISADPRAPFCLVDGNRMPAGLRGEAVVRGDARSVSIAAASICAKTVRDNLMAEAETRWPGYGFAGHKGYPTRAHRAAIGEVGACPIHREGFGGVAGTERTLS